MASMAARRSSLIHFARTRAAVLGFLVALAGLLAAAGLGHAALARPSYTAGDRWTYALQGSLQGLPGLNASQTRTFELGFNGIVQVDILGAAPNLAGGVRAETRASGFLNGTFAIPGGAIRVSGTFSSDASEIWEGHDYLPVVSNSSTGYVINVNVGFAVSVTAYLWVNATTSYASLPSFNLSVGDAASAPFASDVVAATSVSFFDFRQHMENRTALSGVWNRQVLDQETVSVEAGVFAAYRVNQSLGGFPGLAAVAPSGGANETAWFSNDVGFYVKRVAYVNGSPAGEMRLKSYTYPAAPMGLTALEIALLVAFPVAAVLLLAFLVLRRRKARGGPSKGSSGVGPVGELPPKEPGGMP